MNSTNGPSADTAGIERENQALRDDMGRTLDAIERKLSPGQLLDRSLGYVRANGTSIVNSVGDTVRSNPLPLLMTAAGLLWLTSSMYGAKRSPGAGAASDPGVRSGAPNLERLQSSASSAIHSVAGSVGSKVDEIRSGADSAVGAVAHAADATRDKVSAVSSDIGHMMREEPLVLGALGVAIGALIGAALPATEWENKAMGRARDRVVAKAKAVGEEEFDDLRKVVRGEVHHDRSNGQESDAHS